MLYSTALAAILWSIYQAVLGVAYCIRCWTLAAGTVMFVAELVRAGCDLVGDWVGEAAARAGCCSAVW